MKDKRVSLIQFAFKANQTALGDALIPSIQKNKAKLVLVATTCGQNRKKKIEDKCKFYNIPCIEVEPELFEQVSYRSFHSLAICEDGFAKAIIKEMKG